MNTITMRNETKKSLVEYVKENAPKLTNKKHKSLVARISYTMKKFMEKATNVSKQDFMELVNEMRVALGQQMDILDLTAGNSTPKPLPVENSLKPTSRSNRKPTKKVEKTTEEVVEEIFEEKAEEVKPSKKPSKKIAGKKSKVENKKPDLVTVKSTKTKKETPLADNFPSEFESVAGKLKIIIDEVQTIKDIDKLIQDGRDLVFAFYWTKRHLKQFDYDQIQINNTNTPYKEFEQDLDITKPVYISEEGKVVYTVSLYSEIQYTLLSEDIVFDEGMRFNNGIEFNIYEVVE